MKNFLELAKRRKTTYIYSKKAVLGSLLKKILDVGRWAPTPLNSQPYNFIIVKNRKTISDVINASYYGLFHNLPPLLVVIALSKEIASSEPHRGMVKGKLGAYESIMSAAMPALMMSLEAEDLGISSCILSLDEGHLPKELGIKNGAFAPLALGLGYAEKDECSSGQTHIRKPLSQIVRKERL